MVRSRGVGGEHMKAESIKEWVRGHSYQETLKIVADGEVIRFEKEKLCTSEPMVLTVIQTAYIFYEAERERRSEIASLAYQKRVDEGIYHPGLYLGYEPYTFEPSTDRSEVRIVKNLFNRAAAGEELRSLATWMNRSGYRTTKGNAQTSRSIRSILTNPVYVGDVYFRSAGVVIHNHHESLISRPLWAVVQAILIGSKEENELAA